MVSSMSYLVIQGQLTEGRDVLGPFHQDQELLLHRLTDITDTCNSLQVYVSTCTGAWGWDLRLTEHCIQPSLELLDSPLTFSSYIYKVKSMDAKIIIIIVLLYILNIFNLKNKILLDLKLIWKYVYINPHSESIILF